MRVVEVVGFKWKRSSSTCAVVVENHGEIIESNKKRFDVCLCDCVCHTKGRRNERNKLGRGSRLLFTKACAKWRIHGTRRPPLDGWGIIDKDEKIHPKRKEVEEEEEEEMCDPIRAIRPGLDGHRRETISTPPPGTNTLRKRWRTLTPYFFFSFFFFCQFLIKWWIDPNVSFRRVTFLPFLFHNFLRPVVKRGKERRRKWLGRAGIDRNVRYASMETDEVERGKVLLLLLSAAVSRLLPDTK